MLALQTVLTPNPACPVREIGAGLVIMAPQGDATHSLEELGAFIWRQCDGTRDLAGILAAIVENYEVDQATAEQDLLQFAGQMVAAQLLLTD